ncbi:MAG: ABC transporter ATP-binding protein/permease [Oscillospiraceae bacterium]|nr:ABC transporter ATP-binding protein/permease [Oscillospiraceae bacterium]
MLQIQHIRKEYHTGKLVQKALDDVSLNLRDNEFVAILGPSGSGKTTLLNIVGGLDRYDSGDLIINGISTKQYQDRDWDSYRNHTIGFVFQSYNLIPHQTILSNVELALTISGIGKAERRRRARAALEQVGLGDQVEKRPNQLSGGQMQRVAIARALVNDPDILLADEPTGALDSETSVQVMDLLQQVAKDRLVVMVTHNPELADAYATRIVNLWDGKIISDSNPYVIDSTAMAPPVHKNMGKSSMSFLTAVALSFNNLRTKKARTLLISFAGSIGIIGIALILALSTGVNDYIQYIEEDTLSEYPLEISSTGFDMTSLLASSTGLLTADEAEEGEVNVIQMVATMFSTMDSNDLASLKAYFDSGTSGIEPYVNSIEYTYDVSPQIFLQNEDGSVRQVNPDSSFSSLGLGSSASSSSLMSSMMSTDVFYQLPTASKLYENQYEVMAGRWPESYDECVVVLTSGGGISDFMLYSLGLRDSLELSEMIQQFIDGGEIQTPDDLGTYTYEDLMNVTFRLVNASDYYVYDSEYEVWVDKSDDSSYLENLVENGTELKIVGVVQPTEDSSTAILTTGIYYTDALIEYMVGQSEDSEIVQSQLSQPSVNVFTGEAFGIDSDSSELDLGSLFSFDEEALEELFTFDTEDLESAMSDALDLSEGLDLDSGSLDLSSMADLGSIDIGTSSMDLGSISLADLLGSVEITATTEQLSALGAGLLSGYQAYVAEHPEADYSSLAADFTTYLTSDTAAGILESHIQELLSGINGPTVSTADLQALVVQVMSGYQSYAEQQGYTDSSLFDTYLLEYLQSSYAQQVLNQWAAENLQFDTDVEITQEWLSQVAADLAAGYQTYAQENGLSDPDKISAGFSDYLSSDEAQALILSGVSEMLDISGLESQISSLLTSYMTQIMSSYGTAISSVIEEQLSSVMSQLTEQITEGLTSALSEAMSGLGDTLSKSLALDADSLQEAFQMTMDSTELAELLVSLSSSASATYDSNLESMGWADFDEPSEIDIYPIDFDSKSAVVDILDAYNARMEAEGKDEQTITYTDMVGTLMGSVTEIIDIISYVLIAFVAISLVVSSIMIGVITYISVLERKKEIGILRAIGASKRNISQVFNAETFIIGLCAGLLGIGISLLALIPGNAVIHRLAGSTSINAVLNPLPALILVLLSMVLTLIGGLIPSRKAAKSDPVIALRTD